MDLPTPSTKPFFRATSILREGLRDSELDLGLPEPLRGVFVSAGYPLDANDGASGEQVLEINVPASLFTKYEFKYALIEEETPYREAMIPAEELNRWPVRLLKSEGEDAIDHPRFPPPG